MSTPTSAAPEHSRTKPEILREATFDKRVQRYLLVAGCLTLLASIVGVPLIPIWLLVANWFTSRYLERLQCTLTDRSVEVRRGVFTRVEKTVPLDRITDVGMIQGPLMRAFGVHALSVETAGSSSAGALVRVLGIVDAPDFRDAILQQRDMFLERAKHDNSGATAHVAGAAASTAMAGTDQTLIEIRDLLERVVASVESDS